MTPPPKSCPRASAAQPPQTSSAHACCLFLTKRERKTCLSFDVGLLFSNDYIQCRGRGDPLSDESPWLDGWMEYEAREAVSTAANVRAPLRCASAAAKFQPSRIL